MSRTSARLWALAMPLVFFVATGTAAHAAQEAPTRDETGNVVEEGEAPVDQLEVGDCFTDPASMEAIGSVRVVPCAMRHDNEVFHQFDLPDGAFPEEEPLRAAARTGCIDEFEGYVGEPYDESPFEVDTLTPTAESWAAGDREVICLAYQPADAPVSDPEAGESDSLAGPAVVALVLGTLAFAVLGGAAMWRIYTKAGESGWKALIPIWNLIVLLRIVRRPRWWLVLLLVPVVNVVMMFVILLGLARAFGKGVGFGLGLIFLGPVFYPLLAFGSAQYIGRDREVEPSM